MKVSAPAGAVGPEESDVPIDGGRLVDLSEGDLLETVRQALSGAEGMSPDSCLDALEAAHVLIRRLEGARMHAARELAARTAEELLSHHAVSDPQELSRTARERWRARTKSVTATEISTLTGLGRGAARQLVAVALSPASTREPVTDALRAGVATWPQVEHFWRLAGQLPHEVAGDVARALFATTRTVDREARRDDGPVAGAPGVAVERLDADGTVSDSPWGAKQFVQALQREVTRARAADPDAEARARAERHRARTAYAIVDDDGTGQVVITGDAVGTTACVDRLYLLAKRAHAAGDERSEAQLRSDIARALLLHGTLPLPGLSAPAGTVPETSRGSNPRNDAEAGTPPVTVVGTDPPDETGTQPPLGGTTERGGKVDSSEGPEDGCAGQTAAELRGLVTPDDIASLAQIISGTPHYELQVVVPWQATTGTHDGPHGTATLGPASSSDDEGALGHGRPHPGGVGRVVGRATHFVTPGSIREMVLSPGTTLHRILTDPADGRCRERSLSRYQPDAAMRRQVVAADLLSRSPDGVLPVRDGQLDHVTEYLLGGPTTEGNLQGLDTVFHALKTEKFWDAEIDASRTVTWTSLFGRHYRTRPHDYRQYLGLDDSVDQGDEGERRPARPDRPERPARPDRPDRRERPARPVEDAEERRHLASLIVYAALAHRSRTDRLDVADDDPDSDAHLLDDGHRVVWVRQTRQRDGRRVTGPRPGTPTPDRLLDSSAEAVLRADHWTDPFTRRSHGTCRDPAAGFAADTTEEPPF